MAATVTVIGVDGPDLPPAAGSVLATAGLVVGPRSLLVAWAGSAPTGARRTVELADAELPATVLDELAEAVSADRPSVVLAAGDPGCFGVLRALRSRGLPTVTWPSLSGLQRVAAMIQRPWDDIAMVSAREAGLDRVANVCRARGAVAVLTGPGAGPAELAAALSGWRRTLVVVEELCGPGESMRVLDARTAAERDWREPAIVLSLADTDSVGRQGWFAGGEPTPPVTGWGLPEAVFARRAGVRTPPELRALALAKLAPRPGVLLWDVAAGCGALGIEAARLGAAVIAAESDPGLCVRIVANAAEHGVEVRLVDGDLPQSLDGLPHPDAVFLGSPLPDLVRHCAQVGADRILVHVRELDSLGPARDALVDEGYTVDGCQLSAAPLEGLGSGGAAIGLAESNILLWGTGSNRPK